MKKALLSRNLRKKLLQGHPWVYREALEETSFNDGEMVEVLDHKKNFVGWAMAQANGPLALRLLSTSKKPPNENFWPLQFARARKARQNIDPNQTNAYRLFNGEGDGLPGLVCDLYDNTAIVQFDGEAPRHFWSSELIGSWLVENTPAQQVLLKPRGEKTLEFVSGEPPESDLSQVSGQVLENQLKFTVNLSQGQKTGMFLDQRDNRQYIKHFARDKKVLNAFSYTGGFSVYCGVGEAEHVVSLDQAPAALELAQVNWQLNGLKPDQHQVHCADAFKFLKEGKEYWDMVIVDPPSMAHSEAQKPLAINKYTDCFAAAAGKVNKNGDLVLSSCSSHINFDDFFSIINEALSKARRRGQILRVSGQGPDHPYPHACPNMRYLKFIHLVLD